MGLNAALGIASRSLEVFTAGINVAGQNIANAQTDGYIREELKLEPGAPYSKGTLIFGTGVSVGGIEQQIDLFLEKRIHNANTDVSAADAKNEIYKQLEVELGELDESDLSTALNDFLAAVNDVVNQPESASLRQIMIQEGQQFATEIANLRTRVDDLRQSQSTTVDQLVTEANSLINQIADLNPRIAKLEASGMLRSDAGALRSQRYAALTRLSEIVPIRFQERQDGSVDLFTGSDYLILTGQRQQLQTIPSGDRNVTTQSVRLSNTGSNIGTPGSGGELAGIIEGRDSILGGFVDQLDTYAAAVINGVNRVHASGEGLVGFTSLTGATSIDDPSLALNAAGLGFTPTHGSFQIKVTNKLTNTTTTTNVSIDLDGIGTDTSLNSLRAAIDGIGNISASITANGKLKIDADANYEFRFADDTSGALSSLGINTFFTGSDSSDIGINAVIAGDHRYLASSKGGGPGDGSNAVLLAAFSKTPISALNGITLDEFYQNTVSSIAQSSASEDAVSQGLGAFRDSLLNQRDQFSGISLDEEAVKVLEFQRAFQASARLVSVIDELFTVLLQM